MIAVASPAGDHQPGAQDRDPKAHSLCPCSHHLGNSKSCAGKHASLTLES